MSIIIGADIIPRIEEHEPTDRFLSGFDEALKKLFREHCVILNLETPLADKRTPIVKKGGSFCTPTAAAKALKAMGVDAVSIANNHIFDQGEAGLNSTVTAVREAEMDCFGYQQSGKEKHASIFLSQGAKTVAIYACAENEFSVATKEHGGAAPFSVFDSFDEVRMLKEKADLLIVLYHGGIERYPFASPLLQKTCRKFAQCGADLVICQHSHCIGCKEQFENAMIVYGQGNFSFDSNNELYHSGLLIRIDAEAEGSISDKISFLPVLTENGFTKLAAEDEKESILNGFLARSEQLLQPGFLENRYLELAKKEQPVYFVSLLGLKKKCWYRMCRKIFGVRFARFCVNRALKKNVNLEWINFIQCESHRELLLFGLKNGDPK